MPQALLEQMQSKLRDTFITTMALKQRVAMMEERLHEEEEGG